MPDLQSRLNDALTGRYVLDREIGAGGMATVFLARDLRHERDVALKVLDPELAASIGAERFLAEIRTTARLQHPHILPLFDSGEADGFLFYVMPFVDGETLRDRLAREGELSIDDALRIAREVADGLAYAHGAGVVHRDIKPGNILLAGGHATVADFGIARSVERAGGDHLTQTGASIGTPTYMSPEQASADVRVDGRSDIYSLYPQLSATLEDDPVHEPPSPEVEDILPNYGPLKVGCERVVSEIFGDDVLVVRPGFIVGPHYTIPRLPHLLQRFLSPGERLAGTPRSAGPAHRRAGPGRAGGAGWCRGHPRNVQHGRTRHLHGGASGDGAGGHRPRRGCDMGAGRLPAEP